MSSLVRRIQQIQYVLIVTFLGQGQSPCRSCPLLQQPLDNLAVSLVDGGQQGGRQIFL
jgi:hypothetical protein